MEPLSPTTIRQATKADVVLLSQLGAETFQETFADTNTPEDMEAYLRENFSSERLTQELSDPAATFFIAQRLGKPVGYAKLLDGEPDANVTAPGPVELVRLYVLAASIGQGVGAALMKACVENAKNRGFKTLWLGVWEHNPRAIGFYRNWSFHEVGTHVFLLGSDAQTDLIMQKVLQ